MNLRQLQYVHEINKQRLNISATAAVLHTSQPGVSKQLKLLEAEVGAQIFFRARNRLSGITPFGEKILDPVKRIIAEICFIRQAAEELQKENVGTFVVATTHTQARYVLPEVLKRFAKRYSKVRLVQRIGTPQQISDLVAGGEADMGVTSSVAVPPKDLVALQCHRFERAVIVPRNHGLLKMRRVTLKALARYALVAYDSAFTGHSQIMAAFERAGLQPKVVLSASDADVIKACIEKHFGVGVMLDIAFDRQRDKGLCAIPAGHLFQPAIISVLLNRRHYLRKYGYDFIEMFASRWSRASVQRVLASR